LCVLQLIPHTTTTCRCSFFGWTGCAQNGCIEPAQDLPQHKGCMEPTAQPLWSVDRVVPSKLLLAHSILASTNAPLTSKGSKRDTHGLKPARQYMLFPRGQYKPQPSSPNSRRASESRKTSNSQRSRPGVAHSCHKQQVPGSCDQRLDLACLSSWQWSNQAGEAHACQHAWKSAEQSTVSAWLYGGCCKIQGRAG
jgi:hypothetical protein